jgi:riboflavin synthase alpha subunit
MEAVYQRIPITISGKSMQVKKRKEELEYELDLVEKYIGRAKAQRL